MKKIYYGMLLIILIIGIIGCNGGGTTTEFDDIAPVFENVLNKVVIKGSDVTDFTNNIIVEDSKDGNLTDQISVDYGDFNNNLVGEYVIYLTVTDSSDNLASAQYTIYVVEEEDYPAMALLYEFNIGIEDFQDGEGFNGLLDDAYSEIVWTSSHPNIITNEGILYQPEKNEDSVTVTILATLIQNSKTYTREIEIFVPAKSEMQVTSTKTLDFTGTSTEYVVEDGSIEVFYVNDEALPYVDIESFIMLLEGAVDTELFNFTMPEDDLMKIDYSIEYEDFDGTTITETLWAEIDFTENTFTVSNYDFFSGYAKETESDYGEGLNYVDADYIEGETVTIPLGDYQFETFIYKEGETSHYLMPLDIANLLFMHDIYYQVYYNVDEIFGIDTFGLSDGTSQALSLQDEIRESSANDEDIPRDIRLATYNYFALMMDYFYGLKPDKLYDSYYDVLSSYKEAFLTSDNDALNDLLFSLIYQIDDLHTSYVFAGYYEPNHQPGLTIEDLGPNTTAFYRGLWSVQELLTERFGGYTEEDIPSYHLINANIAVIHIQNFTIDTPNDFKDTLDRLPVTVNEVVIDLAYNTGGNIGAVMRMFGYMTENQYYYHSQNPADGSAQTFYLESDYDAYDYKWRVLTSSVTFSAANMFASMAKELDVPVIGQKSSGGASSIGAFILPTGTAVMISTNNVLSTYINDQYISVENGVEVDYYIQNMYNDSDILEILQTIN